jgi:hypothetical protein
MEIGWEAVDWMHMTVYKDHWRALVNRGYVEGKEFFDQLSEY